MASPPKKYTHTHTKQELIFLRAALHKAADKLDAAITANRNAGCNEAAADLQELHSQLVGVDDDEGGSTTDRLRQAIAKAEADKDDAAQFTFTRPEAQAIAVGLPLMGRRLRSMENELKSIGREDVGDWCRDMSEHCEGVLKGHYAEQLAML